MFKREAVALVVLVFYFLVLDQQTQESRLQQLILLQYLKRSRRKRLLLQIALHKTRRVWRAWSWPRNQLWFETLLNGNFTEKWWKENFRISRHTFETWSRKRDRMRLTQSRHHRMWNSMWPQADASVIQTLVADLNHAFSHGKPNFNFFWLTFYCLEWCLPGYQMAFTHATNLPR